MITLSIIILHRKIGDNYHLPEAPPPPEEPPPKPPKDEPPPPDLNPPPEGQKPVGKPFSLRIL